VFSENTPSPLVIFLQIIGLLIIIGILLIIYSYVISPLVGHAYVDPAIAMEGSWEGIATPNLTAEFLEASEIPVHFTIDRALPLKGTIGDASLKTIALGKDSWLSRSLGIGTYRAWVVLNGNLVKKEKFKRQAAVIYFGNIRDSTMLVTIKTLDKVRPGKPRLILKKIQMNRIQ